MKTDQSLMPRFHPLIAQWFLGHVGRPTGLQRQAWPRIAAGEHVLISAPTGSGKTLAAFLWAIDRLVTGKWRPGHTSVLYVSPLKALNNDIRRNLLGPLDALRQAFEEQGVPFPDIRVLTRSGDTPQSDRRRMQRHPPEILITTPESLNLLLSSQGGRSILTGISTVILDEVHGVVNNKRGVHLITAVDRLTPLSGEFQRIALSATIQPLQAVAEFVGGFRIEGGLRNPRFVPRQVAIVSSTEKKDYRLKIQYPQDGEAGKDKDAFWKPFVKEIKAILERNRSTLIFTNTRALCEKLTYLINYGEAKTLAYAHHGSLSREIRHEVEQKLKTGELRAIVATNSLELGIDIGALDEVVLVQSPPSVSSAVQRIGRAGHQVGQVSIGTLLPTHPQDALEMAVLAPGILGHEIESIKPVQSPLDVLAQVIISMVGMESWELDALYSQLRSSYPYRSLPRRQFDLVIDMLAGRYAHSRVRELKPRIAIDRLENTVRARKGAIHALYTSGGTIPDRGYFHLRHLETNAKIGELDEEFVWEAKIGQTLTLGTQNWRIERITHNEVFVLPAHPRTTAPPFWKGEESGRDFHFSERIGRFLEDADDRLDDPLFQASLIQDHCMDEKAAGELITLLKDQKEATGCPLPHRHHLLVEFVGAGPGGYPGNQVVLHTFWGGRINRPFALALEAAWDERFQQGLEVHVSNDSITLQLPHDAGSEEILSLVTAGNFLSLLKKRLEGSGFFGARFRECAGRALLLTRRKFNERMPLWLSRLRSQKLLDAVLQYEDFPLLIEAWRTCLQDEFDLDHLLQVLSELESGSISWTEARTAAPSPMARNVTWSQISDYMYRDDRMMSGKTSMLRADLLHELVLSPDMRPEAPEGLIARFESKRQRLSEGYSPDSSLELLDWVKERLILPYSEWERLLVAAGRDHGLKPDELLKPIGKKLVRIHPAGASGPLIAALEMIEEIVSGLYGGPDRVVIEHLQSGKSLTVAADREPAGADGERDEAFTSLLSDWLAFYGPRTLSFIEDTLGLEKGPLELALKDLVDSQRVVTGRLVKDSTDDHVCDTENFESLLRLLRAEARPAFEPLEISLLPLFLAYFQGITDSGDDLDALFRRIEQLVFYPAQAGLWESEILPARVRSYEGAWLDSLMQQGDLRWLGNKNRSICFYFESDLDLMRGEEDHHGKTVSRVPVKEDPALSKLFPDPMARYDFSTLVRNSKDSPAELMERLWKSVWQGEVTNDSFVSLRRGIETGFKVTELPVTALSSSGRRRRPGMRTAFSRWKGSLPFAGNWQRVPASLPADGLLESEERNKERVRMLLDRYGILFRELLQGELPAFRWQKIFRVLRLMELSGEVLSGYFFHGLSGPQFISHEAFRMLRRKMPEDRIYWICATDPASLCGIQVDALKGTLPRRVAGTHLVYRGRKLVLVSQRNGRALTFHAPEDDADMPVYLGCLHHLLDRQFQPLRRIVIETINDDYAARSPYLDAFRTGFDVLVEYRKVVLYRREV